MPNRPVSVTYKYIDGAHFFVSYDRDAAGLCVANRDLRKAYEEVSRQLNFLHKYNQGDAANFAPTIPFTQFERRVKRIIEDIGTPEILTPAAISKWTRGGGSGEFRA